MKHLNYVFKVRMNNLKIGGEIIYARKFNKKFKNGIWKF